MHWILQDNLSEVAYQTLLDTLVRRGVSHSVHKVVPFVGEIVPAPELNTCNVICMGSYSMRHAAKKYGWNPGVFDLEPFDFNVQRQHWGEHMLNHDAVVTEFKNAIFTEDEMFIRPVHDSKVFAGRVFAKEEFCEWQRKVGVLEEDYGDSLTKNTLIQVVRPKLIYSEHRIWVVKDKIVTSSTYKLGSKVIYQPLTDGHILKYAEERITEWQPHDAFVIDVADTDAGLKVVEINTLNSCGFYACDIQSLAMALEDAFTTAG